MFLDAVLGPVFTVLLLELKQEVEAFLIGEAVEGACKAVHAG